MSTFSAPAWTQSTEVYDVGTEDEWSTHECLIGGTEATDAESWPKVSPVWVTLSAHRSTSSPADDLMPDAVQLEIQTDAMRHVRLSPQQARALAALLLEAVQTAEATA